MTPEVSKSMCKRCGSRYGLHFGDTCPDAYGKPSKTGRKFLAFGPAVPTLSSLCPTCGQKVPLVLKAGDIVQHRGFGGLAVVLAGVSRNYNYVPVTALATGVAGVWQRDRLDLVKGHFHIEERIEP